MMTPPIVDTTIPATTSSRPNSISVALPSETRSQHIPHGRLQRVVQDVETGFDNGDARLHQRRVLRGGLRIDRPLEMFHQQLREPFRVVLIEPQLPWHLQPGQLRVAC